MWSQRVSKYQYLDLCKTILLITSLNVAYQSPILILSLNLTLHLACLVLQVLNSYHLDLAHQKFMLTLDSIVSLSLFLPLISILEGKDPGQEILLMLLIGPFWVLAMWRLRAWRVENLKQKLISGEGKKTEVEQAMLLFTFQVNHLLDQIDSESPINTHEIGYFVQMVEKHNISCKDVTCICQKQEGFNFLFRDTSKSIMQDEAFSLIKTLKQEASQQSHKLHLTLNTITQTTNYQEVGNKHQDLLLNKDQTQHIDITFAKRTFIIKFTLMLLEQNMKKFSFSDVLQGLDIFIKVDLLGHCQSAMVRSQQQRQGHGLIEKISNKIVELYVIEISQNQMEEESARTSTQQIECDLFIQINELYQSFADQIQSICQTASQFWRSFAYLAQLDPVSQYKLGSTLSDQTQSIYRTFLALEERVCAKDPLLYKQFAIVLSHVLNDTVSSQLYLNKMKELIAMKKLIQVPGIGKNKVFNHDCGYVLVSANHDKRGKILTLNQQLLDLLGYTTESVKFLNIKDFLPRIISQTHDKAMDNFFNSTKHQSTMLNRQMTVFLKHSDGYLLPVTMLVKFHYSQSLSYCFVGLFKPLKKVHPFSDEREALVEQLGVLVVDWDRGQLFDASQGLIQMVRSQFPNVYNLGLNDRVILLNEFLDGFNLEKVKEKHQDSANHIVYEGQHKLNLAIFNEDSEFMVRKDHHQPSAKIALYYERYNSLEVGYVFIYSEDQAVSTISRQNQIQHTDYGTPYPELPDENGNSSSQGSSSQSSQSSNMHSSFKTFHGFYKQATPRILKVVVQMVILLLVSSVTIATVNLVINVQDQQTTEAEIRTVKAAYDRINYTVNNRLIMRILLNIANGWEPNTSQISSDRFTDHKKEQKKRITQYKQAFEFIDSSNFPPSDRLNYLQSTPLIKLQFLGADYKIKEENVTFKVAQNLFQSRVTQISEYDKSQLKGNLWIQTLQPKQSTKASEEEQAIYFTVINSNNMIREYNWVFASQYIQDTVQNAELSLEQVKILIIVSIVTILIVTLVISPIISKTEQRKYQALGFFIDLDRPTINQYITQCEEVLLAQQKHNTQEKVKEQEQQEQRTQQLKKYRFKVGTNKGDKVESGQLWSKWKEELGSDDFTSMNESKSRGLISKDIDEYSYRLDESSHHIINQSSRELVQSKSMRRTLNQDEPTRTKSKSKDLDLVVQPQQHPTLEQQVQQSELDDADYSKEKDQARQAISMISKKTRITTLFLVIAFTLIFSIYFISTYFMTQLYYSQVASSIQDLGIIFNKDSCFENLITFIRENQIRNQSMVLSENPSKVASVNMLELCSRREAQYLQLRKKLPDYLSDASGYIERIEGVELCSQINQNQYELCRTSLNGLFQQGLTNSLMLMYRHGQKVQIDFDQALVTRSRNLTFLTNQLKDTTTVNIMDAKTYILNQVFEELKTVCMDSTFNYFKRLTVNLEVVYAVFIFITLVSGGLLSMKGFGRLRKAMHDTNLMLKIICTSESIEKHQREKINKFFIS